MQLIQKEIEPASGAAAIGLLETILSIPGPPKGDTTSRFDLGHRTALRGLWVSSNEKLGDNLKIATLRKLLPPDCDLKFHATLLVKDGTTNEQVKKAVTEYEVADRSFYALKPEAIYSQPIPMEVDAVQVKGKGKGPKGSKPLCKHCGKNHNGECRAKGQQSPKGKSKGGKDGKAKGKGEQSQSETQITTKEKCQLCGKPGRLAGKCYQRARSSR